jgi:hypothetical protein
MRGSDRTVAMLSDLAARLSPPISWSLSGMRRQQRQHHQTHSILPFSHHPSRPPQPPLAFPVLFNKRYKPHFNLLDPTYISASHRHRPSSSGDLRGSLLIPPSPRPNPSRSPPLSMPLSCLIRQTFPIPRH